MAKVFLLDVKHCSGCRNCQIVCKDEHCDQPWLPYAQAQPEVGQFWCDVKENVRGKVPMVWVSYVPTLCAHCDNAPCMDACSVGAIKKRDDGLVLIDPEQCSGCMACAEACPIGAIFPNENLNIAQKCTGCAHLLDNGWTVPRCVDACSTGALKFGDESEFADVLGQTESYPGLEGSAPRVHILNYPMRFCAGLVADLALREVVIGAKVALKDQRGAVVQELETDDFGDFKFDQIEAGTYTVEISAEGYESRSIDVDATLEDVALPEIALTRKEA